MKKIVLIAFAAALLMAHDQKATLKGVVTLGPGGTPVNHATIYVRVVAFNGAEPEYPPSFSNPKGEFSYPQLEPGDIEIRVYCQAVDPFQGNPVRCVPRETGHLYIGVSVPKPLSLTANDNRDIPLNLNTVESPPPSPPPSEIHLVRMQLPPPSGTAGQNEPIQLKVTPSRSVKAALFNPATGAPAGNLTADSGGTVILQPSNETLLVEIAAPGHRTQHLVLASGSLFDDGGKPLTLTTIQRDSGQQLRAAAIKLTPVAKPQAVIRYSPTFGMSRRYSWLANSLLLLPLRDTRSPDTLALLVPGVAPPPETPGTPGPGLGPGVGTAGEFAMNGIRSRENNFTTDGSDNNDEEVGVRRAGFVALFPQTPESLAEFQVIPILADARYGRSLGGQVDGFSRSGASAWHGGAYVFLNWSGLNARGYFDQGFAGEREIPVDAKGTPVAFSGTAPSGLTLRNGNLYQENPLARRTSATRGIGGLTAGGPLGPAGTSVFAAFERTGADSDVRRHFIVPTIGERSVPGLPSATLPATVPGNAIFSLYPFPNNPTGPFGANTYTETRPESARGTLYSFRIDHNRKLISRGDTFTLRYNGTQENSVVSSTGAALSSAIRPVLRTHNVAMYWNTQLTGTLANTFRTSFGQTAAHFDEVPDERLLPSSLFPSTPFLLNAPLLYNTSSPGRLSYSSIPPEALAAVLPDSEHSTGPLGRVEIPGYSPIGVDVYHFPQTRRHSTWQWADTVTWAGGRHLLFTGFDIRRVRLRSNLERNSRPLAVFGGLPGAAPFQAGSMLPAAMAAAGIPTGLFQSFTVSPDPGLRLRSSQADFFVTDLIRLRPRLHLTVGGRINLHRLPKAPDERLRNAFDLDHLREQASQLPNSCFDACVDSIASSLGLVLPADFDSTYGRDRVGNDLRLGLAWSPARDRKTVVRGGWGIYTGSFTAIAVSESRNAFSDYLPLNLASVPLAGPERNFLYNPVNPYRESLLGRPLITLPGSLNVLAPFVSASPLGQQTYSKLAHLFASFPEARLILGVTQPSPNLKHAYSIQQALSIERELGNGNLVSVAYVGTFGRKLPRVNTPSGGFNHTALALRLLPGGLFPVLDGTLDSPARAQVAGAFSIAKELFESTANSRYQALQAELRRRYGQRLQIGAAFTYSHAIDETSDFFDTAGEFALPQNSTLRSESGSSAFDTRLRLALHFTYDLPSWKNRFLLRNWRLAGIFTAQSGQPYTINSAIDVNTDGNLTDRPNTSAGLLFDRPEANVLVRLAPGVAPAGLLAPAGHDGAVGRNSFTSDRLKNFDAAVVRDFPVTEGQTVTVRAEAFNVFNQNSFGIPERILESPGFGRSFYTVTPPRSVRFAVKYTF